METEYWGTQLDLRRMNNSETDKLIL